MTDKWSVEFTRKAEKQYQQLKRNGSKPSIVDIINLLAIEMESQGPYRHNWLNYDSLGKNKFHCHLKKGKPTYVACWELVNKENKKIEVYYVGTHEDAPY